MARRRLWTGRGEPIASTSHKNWGSCGGGNGARSVYGHTAPEIARRAGHGVAVLLRFYAGCIDGHEQIWSHRIGEALADDPAS